jgi:four helix bundle protein
MASARTFEDLFAWQQARRLVSIVRAAIRDEKLGRDRSLADQMLRAARSVMSNIAEGFESNSAADFNRYLGMARGSCAELRSQLYEAQDANLIGQVRQMELSTLAKSTSNLVSSLKIAVDSRIPKKRAKSAATR